MDVSLTGREREREIIHQKEGRRGEATQSRPVHTLHTYYMLAQSTLTNQRFAARTTKLHVWCIFTLRPDSNVSLVEMAFWKSN